MLHLHFWIILNKIYLVFIFFLYELYYFGFLKLSFRNKLKLYATHFIYFILCNVHALFLSRLRSLANLFSTHLSTIFHQYRLTLILQRFLLAALSPTSATLRQCNVFPWLQCSANFIHEVRFCYTISKRQCRASVTSNLKMEVRQQN